MEALFGYALFVTLETNHAQPPDFDPGKSDKHRDIKSYTQPYYYSFHSRGTGILITPSSIHAPTLQGFTSCGHHLAASCLAFFLSNIHVYILLIRNPLISVRAEKRARATQQD